MISRAYDWGRQADWLTVERVCAYAKIFLAVLGICAVVWVASSNGLIDPAGHPIGTDFLNVYAAGLMTATGHAADAYDWPAHRAVEASVIPYDGYFGWHYPPMFLFVAWLLALLPYVPALVVYLAVTFSAYLWAVARLGAPMSDRIWLAAGFPAVFVNMGHGQNGFLTTALLAGGLGLLPGRPVVAGIMLGCLAYKPQFAILVPIALLAGGYWRTVLVAGGVALGLALVSLTVFGSATWDAFFASLEPTRTIVLEQGGTGWQKIVSVFSAVRMWGGGIGLAYVVQTAATICVMVLVAAVWWRSKRLGLSIGLLILAAPLTTPYVLDYDLVVLSAGVMALAREGVETGFRPWEKSVLALVTISPLVARGIGSTLHLPIVPPILLLALVLFAMRAVASPLETRREFGIVSE